MVVLRAERTSHACMAWHGMAWEASFGLFGACQLLEDQMEHAQSHQRAPFSPAALL